MNRFQINASIGIAFLLNCIALSAQSQSQDLPFESLANKLEVQHQVQFFYDPTWFKDKVFSTSLLNAPLDEAVNSICETTKLSFTKLNDFYYVFVPITGKAGQSSDKERFLIVGDKLYYGSKTTAKVKGKVIDHQSKQALPGAVVSISDLEKTMATDQSGRFLMNLPVGDHDLKVTFPNFDDNVKILQVISDGEVTIEMYEKSISLDEIIVTANSSDRNFRRTEMSVLKLDAKSIKELPTSMGESDVLKGLSLMPGIQTSGEFGSGFNVRGGGTDQNLILIEDVPVFNSSHLFGLTSVINSDGVNSMTLYKGGIPVTYGERASSVLNIRMGSKNLTKVAVKGGIGLINSRLNIEVPVGDKLTFMFGGRTSYSDWMLKKMPDEDLMNSSASFYDLNFYANYSINPKNKLNLFAYNSTDKFGFSANQKYNYGNTLGSIRYTHWFNNQTYTSLLFGASYYKSGFSERDSAIITEAYKIDNSILYRNLKWNFVFEPGNRHIVTFGANAFLYDIKPGTMTPYDSESLIIKDEVQAEKGFEWAGFISDDWKISDKINLELGLRFSVFHFMGPKTVWLYESEMPRSQKTVIDSLSFQKGEFIKTYSGLEPRISLRFNLNDDNSIRLSYNRINQYINMVSNTSVVSPSDLWKLSDYYLEPLVCDQFAIGYFGATKSKNYEVSIEAYLKPYKNVIEYKNGASIMLNDYIEADLVSAEGKNFGFETFIKKNMGDFTGWISYTYSKSLRRTISDHKEEQVNKNEWFPASMDRPHNLVINGGYYINKRWRFGFTFNYNTGRPTSLPELNYYFKGYQVAYYSDRAKYRLPDYHRLDISISRYENLRIGKSWKAYWTFSIVNLYGRRNAYSVYYQKEPSQYNINDSKYTLYKQYIIGRPLPTFTYNFVF